MRKFRTPVWEVTEFILIFRIKLTHNSGPLSITFSHRCLFSAKMAIFCVFGRKEYREPKQLQSKLVGVFFFFFFFFSSLEQIFTTIKTIFKIFIFCISTGPHGGIWNLQTPCRRGSSELISKCLSSMILYNYSSYFKSGEISSCRLSPLPTVA